MCRILFAFARALACLTLLCAGAAQAQLVDVSPDQGPRDITHALHYLPSIDPDPAKAFAAYRNGTFGKTFETAAYNRDYAPETWAAVELINTAPADGRPPDMFVATFTAPAVSGLRLYLVRSNGLTETLLDYAIFDPFDPQEHAVTTPRSARFALTPGEQVTLLTHVQLGPFRSFGMALYTPQDLTEATFRWGVSTTAYYAFALSCLAFFFGFQAAMRSGVGMLNAGLFLAFLGLIALAEGLLFRMVFPNRPELQTVIGFGAVFALSGLGFLLAAQTWRLADPVKWQVAARWIARLALLSVAGFAYALWVPGPPAVNLAFGLLAVMIGLNLPPARKLAQNPDEPVLGVTLVTGGAVIGAILVITLAITGWGGRWLDGLTALKAVFALMMLAVLPALTVNVFALRKRHLTAVEARVRALEAEAARGQELLIAERKYSRARDLASLRQHQLATASHDLKQPLMSLRLTFDAMARDMSPEIRSRLTEAFDYLEALSRSHVDETIPTTSEPETDSYALDVPLRTVAQMFADEAGAKGLRLSVVGCSVKTDVPAMVLMRILSNLVSNAIKHTPSGHVLIGVRRGGGLRICVGDTGPGVSPDDLSRLKQPYQKGAESTGHGLGLSVCFDLARDHGLTLDVCSQPGGGSLFALSLTAETTDAAAPPTQT